jgi:hypothetical protein
MYAAYGLLGSIALFSLFLRERTTQLRLITDYSVSPSVKKELLLLSIAFLTPSSRGNIHDLLHHLRHHYPCITKLALHHRYTQPSVLKITFGLPSVVLDNDTLITQEGVVVPSSWYTPASYEELFCVHLHQEQQAPRELTQLHAFAKRVPLPLRQFECHWYDKTCILFKEKIAGTSTHTPTVIIVDTETPLEEHLLEAITRLKAFLTTQGKQKISIRDNNYKNQQSSLSSKPCWYIDARCRDQLIVSYQKGEGDL